jgi:carbonic anhydrase/acetyltransferase-like protein (isoleucine patch superfamily)
MIEKNVLTDFNKKISEPVIDSTAYIHPFAAVIGNVTIGNNVFVAPMAVIRGDEGQPIYIGADSNVQDGVVIHALETESHGKVIEKNLCEAGGKKYAVYAGNRVSVAHQAQIHGPAVILDDTFIGMKSFIFRSYISEQCVIEPAAVIMNVTIPRHRYVTAGSVIKTQKQADDLPSITDDYAFKDLNKNVVFVNTSLTRAYLLSR